MTRHTPNVPPLREFGDFLAVAAHSARETDAYLSMLPASTVTGSPVT